MRTLEEIQRDLLAYYRRTGKVSYFKITTAEKTLLLTSMLCKTTTEALAVLRYLDDFKIETPILIDPKAYEVGVPYSKNTYVNYTHTSGEVNQIQTPYILRAKSDLLNTSFDIFDWDMVTQKTWINSRVNFLLDNYDIFPGDSIIITGELNKIFNEQTITKSKLLIEEYDSKKTIRKIGSGSSSVQLVPGLNLFDINTPVFFDESVFGMIDNSNVSGGNGIRGSVILFDNILDSFEAYFKFTIKGDPKRIIYPEQTTILRTRFYFLKDHWVLLDFSTMPSVSNSYYYVDIPTTFDKENDFIYVKFSRSSSLDKIKFQSYNLNEIPTI